MTPTNPQPEMEISKEAIECARLESLENSINQGERYLRGQYVQALVNQSTAPLREEILVLRKEIQAIEKDCTVEKCRKLEGENFRQEREIERLKKELPKSLADKCFEYWTSEDEVFNQVQLILGGEHPDNCGKDGFVWQVTNTSTDQYDSSVEVVRPEGSIPMNREQADRILDLGFHQVYESIGKTGTQWLKGSSGPCCPRSSTFEAERRRGICNLENQITKLEKENRQLKAMFAANTPGEEIAVMRHELTTKREVLEKCVEELRKQIKHLHSSSAYYQSGQSVLTLANEELKKGQRE